MPFIADFHIHSHFSIATSKQLKPEFLDYWAAIKGITVIGTGDFTHPGWLTELKEKLEPAEQGLFQLKPQFKQRKSNNNEIRFVLTSEISSIYKKYEKVRKVHNVIFAPDFETVEKIQNELSKLGNITSDGRPILGLDSRDLLEIALQANENIFFLPAHIWTPWFSALGSKSGFDSIEACYSDLAPHIYAVETGLSTDPPMNWMCSFLDKYTLLSNSDAHSPEKLGRNANLFDCDLNYTAIIEAIKNPREAGFLGTIDMFPQEGKYHYDGHRKCGICWDPVQTLQHNQLCSECGKPVTMGVMNRLVELSDREDLTERPNRLPHHSLIPLKEILSEILSVGQNSKKVDQAYQQLIQNAGSEFNVLLHLSIDELRPVANEILVEAIRRMRSAEVYIEEGYDGQYGKIKVFDPKEKIGLPNQQALFNGAVTEKPVSYQVRGLLNFSLTEYRSLQKKIKPANEHKAERKAHLNEQQNAAVKHYRGPALCVAGPGTGKTRVLTERIANLIKEKHVNPASILALTFTNKAAQEMKIRLGRIGGTDEITISTFHALGLDILKEQDGTRDGFLLIDEADKMRILERFLEIDKKNIKDIVAKITDIKQKLQTQAEISDSESGQIFKKYIRFLETQNLVDIDDLIYHPALLLKHNLDIQKKYREKFQWILVDEYQDVNYAQYQLIRLLSGDSAPNLFVVGDPNQAIYGFRGADVAFIRRFMEDYPDAMNYRLSKSYRCSDNILKASDDVLRRPSGQKEHILSGLRSDVKIEIVKENSDKSEAEFIARSIEQMLGGVHFFSMDSGVSSGRKREDINSLADFAVLCRTSGQMEAIGQALENHRIPYQRVADTSFLKQGKIKTVVDLFVLSCYPQNRYLQQKLIDLRIIGASLPAKPDPLRTVGQQIEKLISYFPEVKLSKKDQQKLIEYADTFGANSKEFISQAWLSRTGDDHNTSVEKVCVLTMHASKGLEFKAVFISGCEQGLIPYALYADRKADVDEEQRLLYVAMTRAEKYLFLTYAGRRYIKGREWQLPRSTFLDKIEQELLQSRQTAYKPKPKRNQGQRELF